MRLMQTPLPTDFWKACGSAAPLRLLVDGTDAKQIADFPLPFAVLGRGPACDLVLNHPEISRRHAYLQVIRGRLWCLDLLSRTGVLRSGLRETNFCIDPAREMHVGPFRLLSLNAEAPGSDEINPFVARTRKNDPSVTIEFPKALATRQPTETPAWRLDRPITLVGRASPCKIRFQCSSVSRVHCSLVRTPEGVWAIDLLGHDGIFVNDQEVRWAKLEDQDRLRVGRFEMVVHVGLPAGRALTRFPENPTQQPAAVERSPSWNLSPIQSAPPSMIGTMATTGPTQLESAPGADAVQTLLLTFAQQFSLMQQQMFDQFQQSTAMMLQMFGRMQRDQLAVVRQELSEIRELNREITRLHAEMLKHRAAAPGAPGETLPDCLALPAPEASPSRLRAPSPPAHGTSPNGASPNGVSEIASKAAPEAEARASTKANGKAGTDRQGALEPLEQGAPAKLEQGVAAKTTADAPPGEEVYAWLTQRFSELQNERQTRWQKLVGTLMGK